MHLINAWNMEHITHIMKALKTDTNLHYIQNLCVSHKEHSMLRLGRAAE
jgi:hypothetical protein